MFLTVPDEAGKLAKAVFAAEAAAFPDSQRRPFNKIDGGYLSCFMLFSESFIIKPRNPTVYS